MEEDNLIELDLSLEKPKKRMSHTRSLQEHIGAVEDDESWRLDAESSLLPLKREEKITDRRKKDLQRFYMKQVFFFPLFAFF